MKININDITLHYEIKGIGDPVLFLHGNGEDLHIFETLTDAIKEDFTCYSIDSRNHGMSSMTDLYSYDVMTEDVFYFIRKNNLKKVSIVGFSDGAIVALLLALKHPQSVDKMILAGVNITPKAYLPDIYNEIEKEYYLSQNPLLQMMLTEPNIELSTLNKVENSALIIYGENDLFIESSFLEINKFLKYSSLLKMEGHSHDSYIVNNSLLAPTIKKFLS